jgi:hypothetical protein
MNCGSFNSSDYEYNDEHAQRTDFIKNQTSFSTKLPTTFETKISTTDSKHTCRTTMETRKTAAVATIVLGTADYIHQHHFKSIQSKRETLSKHNS